MAQATFDKYIEEGTKLIEAHPDLKGGGVDFETAATDQIASILHAVFDGGFDPVDYADGPEALLDAALRCYLGDQEEKEGDGIDPPCPCGGTICDEPATIHQCGCTIS